MKNNIINKKIKIVIYYYKKNKIKKNINNFNISIQNFNRVIKIYKKN
jgi:hypothetical protein